MRPLITCCLLLLMSPSRALALGVDLSVMGCPGSASASNEAGTLDCAGGASLTLLGTWQPAEALPDLVGIDFVLDFSVVGDIASNAAFWDFGGANQGAIGGDQVRSSAPGCNAYTNTWQPTGSGFATSAITYLPNRARVMGLCYRPTGLVIAANQKMWGFSLTLDTSTSADFDPVGNAGKTGCTQPACVTLSSILPKTVSGNDGTLLTSGSSFGNIVSFNGQIAAFCGCFASRLKGGVGLDCTPAYRQTWGQLKTLYR